MLAAHRSRRQPMERPVSVPRKHGAGSAPSITSLWSCRGLVRCSGLELGAHRTCDLVNAEGVADPVPHNPAWLAADTARSIAFFQERHCLIGPQQLNQDSRISLRVYPRTAHPSEFESLGCWADVQYSPPCRHDIKGLGQEPAPDYQGRLIEHLAVDVNLGNQPAKAVSIRLDFVPMQQAVYDRDVDSHLPTTDPEFLNEDGIRILAVLSKKPGSKPRANSGIAKTYGCMHHLTSSRANGTRN